MNFLCLERQKNIDFIIKLKDNNLVFSIQDYGSGMPKKVQDKLFKEMITTKGKNGTGLGLFMSYSNIKAHFGGNISFESTEEARRYLSNLVKVGTVTAINKSGLIELPEELWFITLEEVKFHSEIDCISNKPIEVIPVRQDELLTTLDNPFNCPHGRPTIISMSKYEMEKKFKRIL